MNSHLTIKLLLFLVTSPALIFATHVIFAHSLKRLPPQVVAALAILVAEALLAALLNLCLLRHDELSPLESASVLTYSMTILLSFGYSYFHLFNTSETARRIRILHEIKEHNGLDEAAIRELYQGGDIVDMRVVRLEQLRQLSGREGRYYLNGRLLYHAAVAIAWWRRVLGIRPSGQGSLTRSADDLSD